MKIVRKMLNFVLFKLRFTCYEQFTFKLAGKNSFYCFYVFTCIMHYCSLFYCSIHALQYSFRLSSRNHKRLEKWAKILTAVAKIFIAFVLNQPTSSLWVFKRICWFRNWNNNHNIDALGLPLPVIFLRSFWMSNWLLWESQEIHDR